MSRFGEWHDVLCFPAAPANVGQDTGERETNERNQNPVLVQPGMVTLWCCYRQQWVSHLLPLLLSPSLLLLTENLGVFKKPCFIIKLILLLRIKPKDFLLPLSCQARGSPPLWGMQPRGMLHLHPPARLVLPMAAGEEHPPNHDRSWHTWDIPLLPLPCWLWVPAQSWVKNPRFWDAGGAARTCCIHKVI